MGQCAGCKRAVPDEYCRAPRLPCPFCGALNRVFEQVVLECLTISSSVTWSQTRPAPNGSATLKDSGELSLQLSGRPPRNEEDALTVSSRLVRRLNASGGNWTDPVVGIADEDAVSFDRIDSAKQLSMQVVRSNTDENFWQSLGRNRVAEKTSNVTASANDLLIAIRKKAQKYPKDQREKLTLVIDASQTPSHTFTDVHNVFAREHRGECAGMRFSSVWVVGAIDAIVKRLDA